MGFATKSEENDNFEETKKMKDNIINKKPLNPDCIECESFNTCVDCAKGNTMRCINFGEIQNMIHTVDRINDVKEMYIVNANEVRND